jgi:hypothetical protein
LLEILILKPPLASSTTANPNQAVVLPNSYNNASLSTQYNLVGGGAKVNPTTGGGVNFLTRITPDAASWTQWLTESNSNTNATDLLANLNGYAIIIRYNGFSLSGTSGACSSIGSPMTDYVICSATTGDKTNTRADNPTITATLPNGYTLIGGGGGTEAGRKNYLAASYPSDVTGNPGTATAWTVSGRRHTASGGGVSSNATAYVVGLKNSFLTSANLSVSITSSSTTVATAGIIHTCSTASGKKIIGGGGHVNITTGAGQMLWQSYPSSSTNWTAASRDSIIVDTTSILTAYCIGIGPA